MLVLLLFASGLFDHDSTLPHQIEVLKRDIRGDVEIHDITFGNLTGGKTAAYLIVPSRKTKRAAALFVHWYSPEHDNSNRTQFINEAIELAKSGVISLLPETMWSAPKWFPSRNRADDLANSAQQTREIRRALDVLLAQPGVDQKRVALVGHDFGAMFGSILASVDRRPTDYALQAGTGRFHHWYLYGPKMEEAARRKFIEETSVLDPVEHIGKAAPAPVLFQFATNDRYVPKDKAEEYIKAAGAGAEVKWYDADHGLNDAARKERIAWLTEKLKL